MTAELPLIGLLRAPDMIRDDVLRGFGDEEEGAVQFAIRWAWDHRRVRDMTQKRAAELCGMTASHFCNALAGKKYLPPHKLNAYEQIVGNRAVSGTIERFRQIRERETVAGLSKLIAEQITKAA